LRPRKLISAGCDATPGCMHASYDCQGGGWALRQGASAFSGRTILPMISD